MKVRFPPSADVLLAKLQAVAFAPTADIGSPPESGPLGTLRFSVCFRRIADVCEANCHPVPASPPKSRFAIGRPGAFSSKGYRSSAASISALTLGHSVTGRTFPPHIRFRWSVL